MLLPVIGEPEPSAMEVEEFHEKTLVGFVIDALNAIGMLHVKWKKRKNNIAKRNHIIFWEKQNNKIN